MRADFGNHGGPAERSQGLEFHRISQLRVFAWLALGFFLSACSSTGNAPLTSGLSDRWTAVLGIDYGAELRISVDCGQGAEHAACPTTAQSEGGAPTIRLATGTHVQADGQSLLFRPTWDDAQIVYVDRGMVQSIDVLEKKTGYIGMLAGAGGGVAFSAMAGFQGREAREEYGAPGAVLVGSIFAAGGAGVGLLIDRLTSRGKFTVVRVYQRDATPVGSSR